MTGGSETKPFVFKSWCKDRVKKTAKIIAAEKKEHMAALAVFNIALDQYEGRFKERVPDEYEAYVNLGLAVINKAVADYRLASKRLMKNPKNRYAKKLKEETVEFFMSEWCSYLSGGIEGTVILEMLERGTDCECEGISESDFESGQENRTSYRKAGRSESSVDSLHVKSDCCSRRTRRRTTA